MGWEIKGRDRKEGEEGWERKKRVGRDGGGKVT